MPIFEERNHTFSVIFTPLEPIPLFKEREQVKNAHNIVLSERQKEILALIREHQGLSMRFLLDHFNTLGKTTIYRELAALEQAKLIYKEGKARSSIWRISP